MKRIINPWVGHPKYNCFGCSPNNPFGLHLTFYEDGDDIVSTWQPANAYQGWINTIHGGILSTLIDEVCGWVVTRKKQTSGFTANLNVKFKKAVSTNEKSLTVRARITDQKRNILFIHAEITNGAGEICTEGDATYFLLDEQKSKEMGFRNCNVEE